MLSLEIIGCFFKWHTEWAGTEAMRDITFLERVPIVLAIHAWGNQLTSKKIVFRVDNEALVAILNKNHQSQSMSWV